jgi:hypothetical protein
LFVPLTVLYETASEGARETASFSVNALARRHSTW